MSHRVTYKSEMKDADLAISALKATKNTSIKDGNILRITAGPLNRASLNLTTGEWATDSDYHHKADDFGLVNQAYSEAEFTREAVRQGVTITSREIQNGEIVLRCRAVATG